MLLFYQLLANSCHMRSYLCSCNATLTKNTKCNCLSTVTENSYQLSTARNYMVFH